jgi:hypothetical protein
VPLAVVPLVAVVATLPATGRVFVPAALADVVAACPDVVVAAPRVVPADPDVTPARTVVLLDHRRGRVAGPS